MTPIVQNNYMSQHRPRKDGRKTVQGPDCHWSRSKSFDFCVWMSIVAVLGRHLKITIGLWQYEKGTCTSCSLFREKLIGDIFTAIISASTWNLKLCNEWLKTIFRMVLFVHNQKEVLIKLVPVSQKSVCTFCRHLPQSVSKILHMIP